MKKDIRTIVFSVIAILVIFIGTSFFGYNTKNNNVLIVQLGEVVDTKTEPGIYFKIPIIQTTKNIYVGERLYDIPSSEVITSDKKSMIANCYVTWKITDPKKYYQTLSSEAVAQGRIDVVVYNAMKNVISSTSQDDVIGGKDGSLGETIMKKISMEQYGITITANEIKVLDLPDVNKDAVYNRMISERNAIAAEYKANGERDAKNIRSAADAKARTLISDAQVIAASAKAEGESGYFKTLADAYGASPERQEFYNFIIGLDAMKESLAKGGTIAIDKDSPLYNILINQN
jgi:membrane protease subunit HflC